ncbi:carbohydrate kinase family protein [Trueperella sp.]|uniref:carbohydrate kinase family protein n=1 Tax=Trueperella sp. TaxID=2699835 RepID=UPI003735B013
MKHAHVVTAGPLFLDIISYGLAHAPVPGEEQWVDGGDIMAGGVANQAVACARLGLDVNVLTSFGRDRAGAWVRELLDEENIRFDGSTTVERQAVTIAQSFDGDRAFTTWGDDSAPLPPADMPAPDYFLASVPYIPKAIETVRRWREAGTTVIVDSCWDPSKQWNAANMDPIAQADIFVPNEVECLKYTREDCCFKGAARFLDKVPALIVTLGGKGALVAERGEGTTDGSAPVYTELPAISATALDTTGAGDSFTAGLVRGLAAGASLAEAAVLGQVTAAWTVERPGGSAAAPTERQLLGWADSGELRWAETDVRAVPDPAALVRRLLADQS